MYAGNIGSIQTNNAELLLTLEEGDPAGDFVNSSLWNQIVTPRNTTIATTNTLLSSNAASGISLLLTCSRFQTEVVETTKELHYLTDRIELIHKDPPVLEDITEILAPLMASLMERREKAKRLYRSTLNSHIESYELDIERIFNELETELARTDELLALHPRRGMFH
ncbi:heterotrimeric G protein gamma subunit Gpg1p [Monosporozyma servazzii]